MLSLLKYVPPSLVGVNPSLAEADKLLNAGFIEEAHYTTWLSNVVLVKKANGKWRMCVDPSWLVFVS